MTTTSGEPLTTITTEGMRSYQREITSDICSLSTKRLLVLRYGAGKSWIMLAAANMLHRHCTVWSGLSGIILCRLRNIQTWKDEIAKRHPLSKAYSIDEIGDQTWELFDHNTWILVPHHLVQKYWDTLTTIVACRPHALICDESTKIKNPKAQRTKACHGLAKVHADVVPPGFRACLTGNATPEGAQEIWSQIQFCFPGHNPLGHTYYSMLDKYFIVADRGSPVLATSGPPAERFRTICRERVSRMTPAQWDAFKQSDKTAVTYRTEYFHETDQQRAMIKSLEESWELEHEDGEKVDQYSYTMQLFAKAQQIANGFWRHMDGETDWLDDNPKLSLLMQIVGDILEERATASIVIWCHYKEDYVAIGTALADADITYEIGPMDVPMARFANHQVSVLLMPVSVSEGFNSIAEVSDIAIFYSNVYSIETRNQAEHRHIRLNQKSPLVTIVDLCGYDSRDRHVIESLQNKKPIVRVK